MLWCCRRKQGLEAAPDARDKLAELADKYDGHEPWLAVEAALQAQLAAAVKALKGKQCERFMEDDQREATALVQKVEAQLSQVDPAWWSVPFPVRPLSPSSQCPR